MVESIIALFIVSLVSITSVTLIFSSAQTALSATYKSQAQYFAEDALACFRAADSAAEFGDAITFRGGFSECTITGEEYTYTLSDSHFKAVVLAAYPTGERASFSIQITDKDGTVITSISDFKKGA